MPNKLVWALRPTETHAKPQERKSPLVGRMCSILIHYFSVLWGSETTYQVVVNGTTSGNLGPPRLENRKTCLYLPVLTEMTHAKTISIPIPVRFPSARLLTPVQQIKTWRG